jgi:hypothetical protein
VEPWYKVAQPRAEVREGRSFNPNEFAIALEQVVAGRGPEDYRDPEKFFARTYSLGPSVSTPGWSSAGSPATPPTPRRT